MVAAGNIAPDNGKEDQYQQDCKNGDGCHGPCCLLADTLFVGKADFHSLLFIVLDCFQQLVYALADSSSSNTQLVDTGIECPLTFLSRLEDLVLYGSQHGGDGIYRIVSFVYCIGIFFLYDIVYLRRIGFAGRKYICQSAEELFRFVMNGIRIMVRNDPSAYMRAVQNRILLHNQAVQLLTVQFICRALSHGFEDQYHVLFLVSNQRAYGVQT